MARTPRLTSRPDRYILTSPSYTSVKLGAGSLVTIAGYQYTIPSDIVVALSGLTASTLYMLYATVSSAGVVSMVVSTSVNSVGPGGVTAWRLVGAFYSHFAASGIGFGAFCTIRGTPVTTDIIATQTDAAPIVTDTGVSIGRGPEYHVIRWARHGNRMIWGFSAYGGFTSAGSGNFYYLPLPTNLQIDTSVAIAGNNTAPHRMSDVGTGHYVNNSAAGSRSGTVLVNNSTGIFINFDGGGTTNGMPFGPNTFAATGFSDIEAAALLPISGWTSTPLEDL